MSSLQAAVRAFATESAPPRAVCASVNRLLCAQMIAGRFATMCFLRLDAARGVIEYANAGHNPPLLIRQNGEIVRLLAGGMVLGVCRGRVRRGLVSAGGQRSAGPLYRRHHRGSRSERRGIRGGPPRRGDCRPSSHGCRGPARRGHARGDDVRLERFRRRRDAARGGDSGPPGARSSLAGSRSTYL